jgi:serine protease AprX
VSDTSDMDAAQIALERMIQRALRSTRFTQDSPVLPDVWIAFGLRDGAHDLLLTPNWQSGAVALAGALYTRLRAGPRRTDGGDPARAAAIAATQSTVAASLTLAELVWAVLPLSRWWHEYLLEPTNGSPGGDLLALWRDPATQPQLRDALLAELDGLATPTLAQGLPRSLASGRELTAQDLRARHITGDLVWLVEVAGTLARIAALRADGGAPLRTGSAGAMTAELRAIRGSSAEVLTAFFSLLAQAPAITGPQQVLWRVNCNREGTLAMLRSTAVVKADAARKLFGVRGAGVRWAVLDSGIDATHLAFRRRGPDGEVSRDWTTGTRVVATYDFSRARTLLGEHTLEALGGVAAAFRAAGGEVSARSVPLSALHGVDWDEWEERLRVPHTQDGYRPPTHRHGTHVAGILAADWRPEDSPDDDLSPSLLSPQHEQPRTGVAPEVELYDIRVADDSGKCNEFAVIAALQFIRALNARHEHLEIAGVNLSLSLLHHAANYACGRTPVCEECERVVASGVIAVAAAGNQGRARYLTSDGELDEGYRSISITDPGNAPSVITVGATHRSDPHGFGVSYFSSRGPTGDGRQKPDLVAPGEKVVSTVPGNREEAMDGTSMAAPHVSGAAVLLLARHPDLLGRPAEVKRVLCKTAVDLERERYFQGAGLLDILQALESI